MQKRPIQAVWPGSENFPHAGTQEAMKTRAIQLDHLHVFGLESASTQSEKGGASRYPLLGFTTTVVQVYQASNGVDVCNELALQLRDSNGMRTWSAVVRALVMRYAAVNAYTSSNVLGVRQPSLTLGEC